MTKIGARQRRPHLSLEGHLCKMDTTQKVFEELSGKERFSNKQYKQLANSPQQTPKIR